MFPIVSIIILNWNGWTDTIECLESLFQIDYPNYNVIVVDNNSQDQSINKIIDYCSGEIKIKSNFFKYNNSNKPITVIEYDKAESYENPNLINTLPSNKKLFLIKNHLNHGFAEGNNIGMKFAQRNLCTDYILLLNNDTVVDKKFLTELVKAAEKKKIGVLGPKIYYYDYGGKKDVIWSLGGLVNFKKFPGYHEIRELNNYKSHSTIKCDYISGAAMMLKSKEIPIIELNKNFFFGCEDVDLCIKLRKEGYDSVTVLDSHIWHKTGSSRNKMHPDQAKKSFSGIVSSMKFLKNHQKNFYLYFPIYTTQILINISKALLRKI